MDNNRDLRSPAVSVGKKLKEAREKKSLTIEQVQKQTKIHSTVLIGLEEARPSDALNDTYIRSFLKKYAQFLNMDSAELLKEYFPARTESPQSKIPVQQNIVPKGARSSLEFLYMARMAAVAIIALMLIIFITGKISTALKKTKPAQKKSTLAVAAKKRPIRRAKAAQKKAPAVVTVPETKNSVPKAAPLALEIKVKKAVRVKLKKDGTLFFNRVLPAGLVEKTIADRSIELDIAKAGNIDLSLNGKPITLPGKNIKISLEITKKGVRIK